MTVQGPVQTPQPDEMSHRAFQTHPPTPLYAPVAYSRVSLLSFQFVWYCARARTHTHTHTHTHTQTHPHTHTHAVCF